MRDPGILFLSFNAFPNCMHTKRKKAFEALIHALTETVSSHDQSYHQTQDQVDLDDTETRTIGAMSQQGEQSDIRNTLRVALENAQAELANVKALENTDVREVGPGAFVETADRTFFIGSSHRSIPFGETELIGLSVQAPAYAGMQGLHKGDTFTLGDTTYTIEDLY
jgi:hypothetical protein